MNLPPKILLVLLLNLALANPLYARIVEQKNLHFDVQTAQLLKGDIHYSFYLLPAKELVKKFPEAKELDSLSAMKEEKVKILMTKSVYIVNRPVGFFDHEHMTNEDFVSHVMGSQKTRKTGKDSFQITVPGEAAHSYSVKSYFDSDDISTLPNSRITQGVTAAKKLDVISQSASSIIFKEFTDFTKYAAGGSAVTSYIPLKEEKTLVISYKLMAIKKYYALDKLLRDNFLRETEVVKDLINSYSKE